MSNTTELIKQISFTGLIGTLIYIREIGEVMWWINKSMSSESTAKTSGPIRIKFGRWGYFGISPYFFPRFLIPWNSVVATINIHSNCSNDFDSGDLKHKTRHRYLTSHITFSVLLLCEIIEMIITLNNKYVVSYSTPDLIIGITFPSNQSADGECSAATPRLCVATPPTLVYAYLSVSEPAAVRL